MEIFGFFMVLLAIAVPVAAFVALSNSNKALREIDSKEKRLRNYQHKKFHLQKLQHCRSS